MLSPYAETTTSRIFPRFDIRGPGNIDFNAENDLAAVPNDPHVIGVAPSDVTVE